MSLRRRRILFGSSLGLLIGVLGCELFLFDRERDRLFDLKREIAALTQRLKQERESNRALAANLALAPTHTRLISESVSHPGDPSETQLNTESQAWLAKLTLVRERLAEHPEQSVPELQTLDLLLFLGAVKHLEFATEEQTRASLARVRDTAKSGFVRAMSRALTKYLNDHRGELPPATSALAPYLENPSDRPILERYQMKRSGVVGAPERIGQLAVLEVAPIDPIYDRRYGSNVALQGSRWLAMETSSPGPTAWIDGYPDRLKQARAAYSEEHNGQQPAGLADVTPYFSPSIEPTFLEKLIEQEKVSRH